MLFGSYIVVRLPVVKLIRKQFYITAEQDAALRRIAADQHTTQAVIIRRALDAWLAMEHGEKEDDPFRPLIGMVDVPVSSAGHDDIYDYVVEQDHDRR